MQQLWGQERTVNEQYWAEIDKGSGKGNSATDSTGSKNAEKVDKGQTELTGKKLYEGE